MAPSTVYSQDTGAAALQVVQLALRMAHYAGWDGETPEHSDPLMEGGEVFAGDVRVGRIARTGENGAIIQAVFELSCNVFLLQSREPAPVDAFASAWPVAITARDGPTQSFLRRLTALLYALPWSFQLRPFV